MFSSSVGVFFCGGPGAIAMAQELVPPENAPAPEVKPETEAFPLLTLPTTVPDERLNPSGNPLMFPTKPEEVDTTVRQAITLDEAIALALRNNEQLQTSKLTLEQQQANLIAARAALYPSLDTDFTLSRDSSAAAQANNALSSEQAEATGNIPILRSDTSTNATGNINLTYNIYNGGERGAQIAKAEQLVQNSRLQVEVVAEQTRSQSLRDARLLEQAGLGTRFDVLRAEGDLATANEALTRAIAEQRNARRRLAQLLSVGQRVELTAADAIVEAGDWTIPLEESIVKAYKNRAELEQQLVQIEVSEQDRYIALAAIKPRVDFVANYNYQNDFDSSAGVVDGYSFAARVRWNLFDGGRALAEARQADRQMDIAKTAFSEQRNQVRLQVEESYYTLISNKENIGSTRTNVIRFEEALRLARLRFQAGVGTQTDVINAQRDLANARGRFLQAIIGYNQSLNQLQRSISNLPDNHLFDIQS